VAEEQPTGILGITDGHYAGAQCRYVEYRCPKCGDHDHYMEGEVWGCHPEAGCRAEITQRNYESCGTLYRVDVDMYGYIWVPDAQTPHDGDSEGKWQHAAARVAVGEVIRDYSSAFRTLLRGEAGERDHGPGSLPPVVTVTEITKDDQMPEEDREYLLYVPGGAAYDTELETVWPRKAEE
jgi:hypothetical protein